MNAFITGSYAYGVPNKNSDIDLVICLDPGTIDGELLWDRSDSDKSCRFGKLNLILLAPDRFAEWKRVNDELLDLNRYVSREEAVAAFQAAGFGVDDYGRCSVEVAEGQVEYEDPSDDPDFVPSRMPVRTLSQVADLFGE